ncbi:MAG: hypothetical protein EXS08_07630 [Planctomycetes bacterium]|nr:hypothetical protein [Planctomycetota bacterium]
MEPLLERSLAEARGILFLCSGNMVRSAFADLYARHLGCPLPVGSAASLFRNDRMLRETALALQARGVSPAEIRAFRPGHIADIAPGLGEATLVLAMSRMHLQALASWPALQRRSFLLSGVLGETLEIADPVLEGADFERTFARLARCVEELVLHLRHAHGS